MKQVLHRVHPTEETLRLRRLPRVHLGRGAVALVDDELHPQLGDLVHDLELQLVGAGELVGRLLQREQLLGADVLLVVGERRGHRTEA